MVGFSWPCGCCDSCAADAFVIGGLIESGGSSSPTHQIERFVMNTETFCATVSEGPQIWGAGAASNGDDYIYYGGGSTSVTFNVYKMWKLSTETHTVTEVATAELAYIRSGNGLSDISTKGFWISGHFVDIGGGKTVGVMNKLTFSSETCSEVSSMNPPNGRVSVNMMTEGTNYGYIIGGREYGSSSLFSDEIDECDYSTETASLSSATMITERRDFFVLNGTEDEGYYAGGILDSGSAPQDITDSIEKLAFASETVSAVTDTLTEKRIQGAAFSNGIDKGYFITGVEGDDTSGGTNEDTNDKLTYSTETISVAPDCPTLRQYAAGGSTNGY